MKIMSVTFNPAIDQTITLEHLSPGRVHRAEAARYNAGGKGVNVSACLADWGLSSLATGFLGRDNALIFEYVCRQKSLEDCFLRLPGQTRVNIKIVDRENTTDINLPGLKVTQADLEELTGLILKTKPELTILAGSQPPGCPAAIYSQLIAELKKNGGQVVLDAHGPALSAALAYPELLYAVKPNLYELSQWAGRELSREQMVAQALALNEKGLELVVVSMGEEGAVFVAQGRALIASGRPERIVSTVGAGDAMVAGLCAARVEMADLERTARLATAFSLAKLAILGPNLPARGKVEEIAAAVSVQWITSH